MFSVKKVYKKIAKSNTKKTEYKGKLDELSLTSVRGWCAEEGSESPVSIELYVNGDLVGIITSNLYRGDLFDAGINKGLHGFEFSLTDYIGSKEGEFNIFLKVEGSDFSLMNDSYLISDKKVEFPKKEYRTLKLNSEMKSDVELLSSSGLFDGSFYTSRYPDVLAENLNPLEHFVRSGAREGRDPNLFFDTKFYKNKYLNGNNCNPLVHYINTVKDTGAKTCKSFDSGYYLQANGDVRREGVNPLLHYLTNGIKEGREICKPKANVLIASPTNDTVSTVIDTSVYRTKRPVCSIIIPVYNAVDETKMCIDSVLKHTDMLRHEVIVMNDCSPDPKVKEMLVNYDGVRGLNIVHNEKNLGYTFNVNKGIDIAGSNDVLLLNSDTVVTDDWLRNIQVAAYAGFDIGTVTAVSNNAGAFSVPKAGTNAIPDELNLEEMASIVSKEHDLEYMDVPTGNGFCFYIKRELLDQIGMFDEELFPRGYGEENDFCMRAIRSGWRNIVDFKTYVYHVRTASFKEEKQSLIETSMDTLKKKYPNYTALTKSIACSPIMQTVRNKIDIAIDNRIDSKDSRSNPVIMYVLSTMTGGTPQTNKDLMSGVSDNFDTYVLACDRYKIEVLELESGEYKNLETYVLKEPILFAAHGSSEYQRIAASILFKYSVDILHVRHIGWHDLSLPRLAKELEIKVIYSLHDFYTICPSVNLIDNDAIFFPNGVESNAANPLWNDDTCLPSTPESLKLWKQRMNESLSYADLYITTNQSGKEILMSNLDVLKDRESKFHVVAHGRDFETFNMLPVRKDISESKTLNILLPGNIGHSKGARLIKEIKLKDTENKFTFHVLGKCVKDLKGYVVDHGEYKREEFASKVKKINPDITAIFSIWPETYCHTLTESWANGLPVIAVDLGAVGDRISRRGGGWLTEPDASKIESVLIKLIADAREINIRKEEIVNWQNGYGRSNSVSLMSGKYKKLYKKVLGFDDV